MEKGARWFGGGALVVAGGLILKETLSWGWSKFLDYLRDESGRVNWSDLPWANMLGVVLMCAGIVVLAWPWIQVRRIARKSQLSGQGGASIAPHPYDDTSIRQSLTSTADQIGEVRRDIDRVLQEIAPLINERRTRLRSELLATLKRKKFPMPSAGDSWPSSIEPMLFNIDFRSGLSQCLADAGIPLSVGDVVKETAERVNGNAVYCTIPPEENDGRWQDGKSKQQWHRHNAALDAIISKVSSP